MIGIITSSAGSFPPYRVEVNERGHVVIFVPDGPDFEVVALFSGRIECSIIGGESFIVLLGVIG